MTGSNRVYRKAAPRKKTAPARRVVLSPEARKAYEKLVEDRETSQREYLRHLAADTKPK